MSDSLFKKTHKCLILWEFLSKIGLSYKEQKTETIVFSPKPAVHEGDNEITLDRNISW